MADPRIAVIVNPKAAGGKAIKKLPEISSVVSSVAPEYLLHVTGSIEDARLRAREFAMLGDSNQLPACLVRTDSRKRICGPAMVDTGASGLRVQGAKTSEMSFRSPRARHSAIRSERPRQSRSIVCFHPLRRKIGG